MPNSSIQISVNGEPRAVPQGTTLAQLLQTLELNPRFVAVERNLEVAPRTQHETCRLEEGDRLEEHQRARSGQALRPCPRGMGLADTNPFIPSVEFTQLIEWLMVRRSLP